MSILNKLLRWRKKKVEPETIVPDQGEWIDANHGNTVFRGHVTKDLSIGDRYEETDEKGKVRRFEVKEKYVHESGVVIVRSAEVLPK